MLQSLESSVAVFHQQSVMKRVTDSLPLFQAAHHGWLARVAENRELVDGEGHSDVHGRRSSWTRVFIASRSGAKSPDAAGHRFCEARARSERSDHCCHWETPVSAYVFLAVFVEHQDLATRTQLH